MNATAGPPESVTGTPVDRANWLRVAGGMMFGAGALVLLIRKSDGWSDWATFFGLLIPALVLFAVTFAGRVRGEDFTGWQVGFLVFGTLLLLGSLLQFVNAVDGHVQSSLNIFWTFGLAAVVGVFTSLVMRAPFQMLLGGLLGLVAWLALWDKLLSNPSGDTLRWLLLVLAAIYLGAAIALMRRGMPQASDLMTAAGIAAVLAAGLSFAGAAGALNDTVGSLSGNAPKPGQGWNVFLLVVSLALIAYESRAPTRGPGYVGAFGLIAFIGLTGADLVNRLNGDEGGGVAGWPLILLIGGGAAIVGSFVLGGPGFSGGAGPDAGPGPDGPGLAAQPPPYGQPGFGAPPPVPPEPGATQPHVRQPEPPPLPPPGGPPPPQ